MAELVLPAGEDTRPRAEDQALRRRARAVIPGGMYGHQSAAQLPPDYPQFMRGGRGALIWDADGRSEEHTSELQSRP